MDPIAEDYPRSAKNFSCLGPCYRPGVFVVHPITLKHVTNNDYPFCPVNEWEYTNPDTGKKEIRSTDKCFDPIRSGTVSNYELSMNIITPKIDFTCESFLKIYYNIYSMESTLEWLKDNSDVSYFTKRRVLDCAWTAYGFSNYILDDRLIFFYLDLVKEKRLNGIYNKFYKYISIDGDNVFFKKNIDEKDYKKNKKKEFIKTKGISNNKRRR